MGKRGMLGLTMIGMALGGCGTAGTAARSAAARGAVAGEAGAPAAVTAGPVVIHAFNQGGRPALFMAPAGRDLAQACRAEGGRAPRIAAPRDQLVVLHVPEGAVACVGSDDGRRFSLLWHAAAGTPGGSTLRLARAGLPE